MAKKPPTYEAMLERMAALCSRSEQCSGDLRDKMLRAGLPASDAGRAIAWLTDNRFLDDARFAGCFARDKVKFCGWGRIKIRAALASKRLPSALVAEALDSIADEDYMDALLRVASAKARNFDLDDYPSRIKVMRHLASRGFEPAMCAKAVDMLRLKEDS